MAGPKAAEKGRRKGPESSYLRISIEPWSLTLRGLIQGPLRWLTV